MSMYLLLQINAAEDSDSHIGLYFANETDIERDFADKLASRFHIDTSRLSFENFDSVTIAYDESGAPLFAARLM